MLRRFVPFTLLLASISCMAQTSAAPDTSILRLDPALDRLIAPDAPIELAASGLNFTEGPMWREGRLWFQDEEDDKTYALAPDGALTVLVDYKQPPFALTPSASNPKAKFGPNGMAPAPDGTVVMCEQYKRGVEKLSGPANHLKLDPLFNSFEGHHLNSPNDIVFARDGSFYFTDPTYGLQHGMDKDPAKEMPFNGVFHVRDGKLTAVVKDLTLPNGIALSPDEKTLYVDNTGPDQKVMAYDVLPDGSLANARVFIAFTGKEGPGGPDGMKLDAEGNVWVTGPGGMRIITPQGKVLGQLKLPLIAANLAWSVDGHTVYITARAHVYRLRTLVHGLLPNFAK